MDYEKAYKEALDRAKVIYNKEFTPYCKDAIEEIFPELQEDEDERIRKALISYFKSHLTSSTEIDKEHWEGMVIKDILAWLEKQDEQKLAEWSEEDERMLVDCFNILHRSDYSIDKVTKTVEWLKSLKERAIPQSKQDWNKEDDEMFDAIIADINFTAHNHEDTVNQPIYEKEINWLLKKIKEKFVY